MDPYITFVVSARNDKHGKNFLHRLQIFINGLVGLSQENNLDFELIIVEWNPPKNNPRLKDSIIWPKNLKPNTIRIIEVPNEIHKSLPNSDKISLFQYSAKNVGIHRARGDYIIATNADIFFSEELIKFLSSKKLSKSCFYRINRYDVSGLIPMNLSLENQLEFCSKKAFSVFMPNGIVWLKFIPHLWSLITSYYFRLKRFIFSFRSYQGKFVISSKKSSIPHYNLHIYASGDFFLMAKEHWYEIRGYPQLGSHNYIDSYPCFMADTIGLKQIVLKSPLRIYHMDHKRSLNFRRPSITIEKFYSDWKKTKKLGKLIHYNQDDWGFAHEQFPEYKIN
ncbi:MAG: hypothetical protein ACFFDN_11135 [Candidatus Hodarchaeota archaeon]